MPVNHYFMTHTAARARQRAVRLTSVICAFLVRVSEADGMLM